MLGPKVRQLIKKRRGVTDVSEFDEVEDYFQRSSTILYAFNFVSTGAINERNEIR
jgi:hypothetical protein